MSEHESEALGKRGEVSSLQSSNLVLLLYLKKSKLAFLSHFLFFFFSYHFPFTVVCPGRWVKAGDFLFSLPLLIRGPVHLRTSWGLL